MQQGTWARRFAMLQERLQTQGMPHTLGIYCRRVRNMLFSHYAFAR